MADSYALAKRHSEGNVNRHPERQRRICYRGEGSRKLVTRGIDSSLRATVPFPVFSTQHSYLRSE